VTYPSSVNVLVVALRADAPPEVPGGASVTSLVARLRPPAAMGFRPDAALKPPADWFRECMLANDLDFMLVWLVQMYIMV